MEEIWKDIENYEGLYQVSNLGKVRAYPNIKHSEFKILKQAIVSGYYIVCLRKNNKSKNFRVHRLVAEAFIPNPNNYPMVGHKDENNFKTGNGCNNCVDNLEWCTFKHNSNMPKYKERMSGSNNPMYGKKRKVVKNNNKRDFSGKNNPMYGKKHSESSRKKMSESRTGEKNHAYGKSLSEEHKKKLSRPVKCVETGIVYYGATEAEKQTGIFATSIIRCCKGKLKTTGGFHWEYV